MTSFGVERPLVPVRCARCNKLIVEHFNGTSFVAKCGRCGIQVIVVKERLINAVRE